MGTHATPRGTVTRRAALALAGAPLATPAFGQAPWPTGPVRYVCVFPPGGSTDTLSEPPWKASRKRGRTLSVTISAGTT